MCRLFGYVAAAPVSVAECLGDDLGAFTALTCVHGDGWGSAWRTPDGVTGARTSPTSAADDPEYDELVDARLGAAGLLHLRWATDGLAVTRANTHPFVDGDLAFAHNGSINPIDRLHPLLDEEQRVLLRGDTDSERYFRFLVQQLGRYDDEVEAVQKGVAELASHFPESSLNALLLTGAALYAVHHNSRASGPSDELRELFDPDRMPRGHESAYFELGYRVTGDAVHVVSSGLAPEAWESVPPDTVLRVDLQTRQTAFL